MGNFYRNSAIFIWLHCSQWTNSDESNDNDVEKNSFIGDDLFVVLHFSSRDKDMTANPYIQCDQKKIAKCLQKMHKNDFTRNMIYFSPLQEFPKNVGDLGKLIVAKSPINHQIWSH